MPNSRRTSNQFVIITRNDFFDNSFLEHTVFIFQSVFRGVRSVEKKLSPKWTRFDDIEKGTTKLKIALVQSV